MSDSLPIQIDGGGKGIMKLHIRLQPLLIGVGWAAGTIALMHGFRWLIAAMLPISPYLFTWSMFLLMAVVLGTVAGLLAQIRCQVRCGRRAAVLAVLGMVTTAFNMFDYPARTMGIPFIKQQGLIVLFSTFLLIGIGAQVSVAAVWVGVEYFFARDIWTAVKNSPRLQPVWTGIKWAIAIQSIGLVLGMFLIMGSYSILNMFLAWLYLLLLSLPLGALAGLLAQICCPAACRGRAAFLAGAGMLSFFLVNPFVGWDPIFIELISQFLSIPVVKSVYQTFNGPSSSWSIDQSSHLYSYFFILGGLITGIGVELIAAGLIIGVSYVLQHNGNSQSGNL